MSEQMMSDGLFNLPNMIHLVSNGWKQCIAGLGAELLIVLLHCFDEVEEGGGMLFRY